MGRRWGHPDPATLVDYVQARTFFVSKHGLPVGHVASDKELNEALNGHLQLLDGGCRVVRDIVCYLRARRDFLAVDASRR